MTYTPMTEAEEAAMRRHMHELSERNTASWAQYLVDELHSFIDRNIYNGAPGKGQALYNDGGNPWLHEQVGPFVESVTKA